MQFVPVGWPPRWAALVRPAQFPKELPASSGQQRCRTTDPRAVSSAMAHRCRGDSRRLMKRERLMSKRPHIICHMASSIDGKIDSSALRNVMRSGEYEALHSQLGGNAWLCGRTTMQQHFADSEPFV